MPAGGGFGRKGIGLPGEGSFTGAIPAQRLSLHDAEQARKRAELAEYARATAQDHHGDAARHQSAFGIARTKRSLGLAYLLWLLFSNLSVHRFYLGGLQAGLPQLGTLFMAVFLILIGGTISYLGIFILLIWCGWILLDLFLMPGLHRRFCTQGETYNPA